MRFGPSTRSPDSLRAGLASLRDDGAYVTDGRRLFRVAAPLRRLHGPDVAILEDCGTLTLVAFTAEELYSMPLTPVTVMHATVS